MQRLVMLLSLVLFLCNACAKQKGGSAVQDPVESPVGNGPIVEGEGDDAQAASCVPARNWKEATEDDASLKLLAKVFVAPESQDSQAVVKKAQEGKLTCPPGP